jgi:hypothetical protein
MTLSEASAALARKLPLENPSLRRRFDRAYDMIRMPGYELKKQPDGCYIVEKLSSSLIDDTSALYYVTDTSCTCPDYQTLLQGLCKHRIAIMLLELIEGE